MKFFIAACIACVLCLSGTHAQIKIVSGIENEVYHQFANDIRNNTDEDLAIFTTQGSVDNFNFLQTDSIHIAFMQYDVLLFKELEEQNIKERIKIFLPLYEEEIHLITKNNDLINNLGDLKNKRVGKGSVNAGSHVTAAFIRLKSELKWEDFDIPFSDAFSALLNDSIDAFFFVGAAPANALSSLSKDVSDIIKLVPIVDQRLDDFYARRTMPAGTYPWADYDVRTYTVKSTLVVNTANIPDSIDQKIELLLNDLKESLKAIQKNKLSHPKWTSVNFSDLDGLDWPVYKQQYVTAKTVFNVLAIIAAILTFFQIYFIVNKLWKRKHEKVVAESISLSAMMISIFINSFFGFKNIINDGMPQFAANLMWITCSVISTLVGIGLWVVGSRQKGFWKMVQQAFVLEARESADLAKSFFRPSGADKIIDILGQLAMIDDDLDPKEKEFIQSFADAWGINIKWEYIEGAFGSKKGAGYHNLRKSMTAYLSTSPPQQQVSQLADVIQLLVNIDDKVTMEEELILAELAGLTSIYIGQDSDFQSYNVAVVPQDREVEQTNQMILNELTRQEIAGGYAYVSEPFFSNKYAEIICEKYRKVGLFSVVVQLEHLMDKELKDVVTNN